MKNFAVFISAILFPMFLFGQDNPIRFGALLEKLDTDARYLKDAKSLDERLECLKKAKDARECASLYRSLFHTCSKKEIQALNSHRDDSISIQSAWELVTLTVPIYDGERTYKPDAKKLEWFIGFFEGRNRVTVPPWWRDIVIDSRANRRDNIYPGSPKSEPYHKSGIQWVKCPSDASVSIADGIVTYHQDETSIVVPDELLMRTSAGDIDGDLSGCFQGEFCFLTRHGDTGYPHKIACINRQSNKVVWTSEACGCWWGDSEGPHRSWVSVMATDDGRLFVFGSASIGFYAHEFSAADGKTLMQFSSGY